MEGKFEEKLEQKAEFVKADDSESIFLNFATFTE